MLFADIEHDILIIGGAIVFSLLVICIIMFIFLYQNRHHKFIREKMDLQNSFQQEILKTQLETQEQTFHQIGEELHDNIGQLLSSTRMLLGIAERTLPEFPDTLKTADQTLAKAIKDLRLLSKSLNKEWLHQFNLLDNLATEIHRINTAQTVEVHVEYSVRSLPLDPESQVMLFRIIQEALHNAIRHSGAQNIYISIRLESLIEVVIRDDGRGFPTGATEPFGVGLLNMNHRTGLLSGNINWNSVPGKGTEVTISIPVQNEEK